MIKIYELPSQIADKKYAQAIRASLYFNGNLIINSSKIANFYIDTIKYLLTKTDINNLSLCIDGIVENGTPNDEIHVYQKVSTTHSINVSLTSRDILSNIKVAFEKLTQQHLLDLSDYEIDFQFRDVVGNDDLMSLVDSIDPTIKGYNKIFYGAPGCGKSRKVRDFLNDLNVSDSNQFRVTFHPEYSNFDFVGQILPTIREEEIVDSTDSTVVKKESKVEYIFNRGPFVLALERAFQELKDGTDRMVYLIIEEINRGNAAAIFGDLFQLLDRDLTGKSEYPIINVNVRDILNKDGFSNYTAKGVYIPNNLTIIATMNTSDQNVFTLDTAFKRRWEFEQVSNVFSVNDSNYNLFVPGTSLLWRNFVNVINKKITDPTRTGLSGEDKRIGKYFVKNDVLFDTKTELYTQQKDAAGNVVSSTPNAEIIEKATAFAYKILEYIWNDVAKFDEKTQWFDISKNHTLEELIASFIDEKENNPLKVFTGIDNWN